MLWSTTSEYFRGTAGTSTELGDVLGSALFNCEVSDGEGVDCRSFVNSFVSSCSALVDCIMFTSRFKYPCKEERSSAL